MEGLLAFGKVIAVLLGIVAFVFLIPVIGFVAYYEFWFLIVMGVIIILPQPLTIAAFCEGAGIFGFFAALFLLFYYPVKIISNLCRQHYWGFVLVNIIFLIPVIVQGFEFYDGHLAHMESIASQVWGNGLGRAFVIFCITAVSSPIILVPLGYWINERQIEQINAEFNPVRVQPEPPRTVVVAPSPVVRQQKPRVTVEQYKATGMAKKFYPHN